LLKLYWRLELAVGIAHFLIKSFCTGEAGRPVAGFAVGTVPGAVATLAPLTRSLPLPVPYRLPARIRI
jgi:hypothetical protein